MMSTQYLFGIDAEDLENKFYFDALDYKLIAGRRLFRELYMIKKPTKEEEDRMFYVDKAMKHTERLLWDRERNE